MADGSEGTVVRPAHAGSAAVHALLRHLAEVGFTGAPRPVGDGFDADGNEVLTDVGSTVAYPYAWSDDGVWGVGRMLRELHAATSSFRLPPGLDWQPWWMHEEGPDSVLGHCDAGPWHVVARDGLPVALLGWDLTGPVHRLDEVAATAAWNACLRDDDIAARYGFPDVPARARQVGLFLDGYGLPAAERAGMVTRMIEFTIRDCAAEAIEAGVTPESRDPAPLWGLAWRARAAAWMIRHRAVLERHARG